MSNGEILLMPEIQQSPNFSLPVANMRSIYKSNEIQGKLDMLLKSGNEREYEALCNIWKKMLDRGPDRFALKLSGVPDMTPLYNLLPNF